MQFELNAIIDKLGHTLVAIVADEADESLWFEIYVDGKAVQIPLSIVKSAVEVAPSGVHSEAWFDRNLPADSQHT